MSSRHNSAATEGGPSSHRSIFSRTSQKRAASDESLPCFLPGFLVGLRGLRKTPGVVADAVTGERRKERLFLIREDDPQCAYQLIPEKKGKKIRFGIEWICVVFKREGTTPEGDPVFREPADGNHKLVTVKELRMVSVTDRHVKDGLTQGLTVMQLIGDNKHVIGYEEVLQDNQHLYVVTPFLAEGLFDAIPWDVGGMRERLSRRYFRQILSCLRYLKSKGICHRNLCPENIMIHDGRCVVVDLENCLRVPVISGSHALLRPQGACGKGPYMTPEIFANKKPFDGYAVDLWAAGTILYTMLTGLQLYQVPNVIDVCYHFYIVAGGLSNKPLNDRTIKLMQQLQIDPKKYEDNLLVGERSRANRGLSWEAKDLLQSICRPLREDRSTLEQVEDHEWVADS